MSRLLPLIVFVFAASVAPAAAQEGKLMHCFAFTEIEDAKDADWDAFIKETKALPEKIDGLETVWVGKLRRELGQYNREGKRSLRQWGVCMEMKDSAALETYADHPAHTAWVTTYGKVRKPGTTTFDIIAQ